MSDYSYSTQQPEEHDVNDPTLGPPFGQFSQKWVKAGGGDPEIIETARSRFTTNDIAVRPTRPPWANGRCEPGGNELLLQNMNASMEAVLPAALFQPQVHSLASIDVFASKHFPASLIPLETLEAWGYGVNAANLKCLQNPRGGRIRPIGFARLYIKFYEIRDGSQFEHGFYCNMLVIDKLYSEIGVHVILGGGELDRLLEIMPALFSGGNH